MLKTQSFTYGTTTLAAPNPTSNLRYPCAFGRFFHFFLLFRAKDARSRLAAGIFIYMSFFFAPCAGSSRTTLSTFAVPGNISTAAARTAS